MIRGRPTATVGRLRAIERRAIALALFVAAGASCKSDKGGTTDNPPKPRDDAKVAPTDAAVEHSPIYVDPKQLDFTHNRALLDRLLASPYGYFRFTNIPFSQTVCKRFGDKLRAMPTVNLHGDAHLENYAVTKTGRGLTDFDDSSAGPAVIDLVRFGVAIQIACHEKGWSDDADRLVESFLKGYRDALTDPNVEVPVPAMVERLRKQFTTNRKQFLEFADSLMQPIPEPERAEFEVGYKRYAELMLSEHPDLPKDFFDIERLGRISVGFGSALDTKYLIRVRGKSASPDDDTVLEAKEVRDLSGIECINSRKSGGAFRILVGQARIAEVPHEFLAQVPHGTDTSAPPFWVHAWQENYVELTLASTVSPEDLEQITYDVGIQLGRGHVRQIATPLDSQLRKAQLDTLASLGKELNATIADLSKETLVAWEQFKADAKRLNLTQ